MLYAHSKDDDQTQWQPLHEHLENVAELCGEFAKAFGYEQWGRVLGLLHDAGKSCDRFQKERLRNRPVSVDHAAFGAARALELYGGRADKDDPYGSQAYMGELLAYAILGHHGGMKTSIDVEDRVKQLGMPPAPGKAVDNYSPYHVMIGEFPDVVPPARLDLEPMMHSCIMRSCSESVQDEEARNIVQQRLSFSGQALTRMLFSCLVDADWIDTERFMSPEVAEQREHGYDSIPVLLDRLENHLDGLASEVEDTPVNEARAAVLADCREGAASKSGLFTLTVPTGGGKTLSSMEFALRHAAENGLERVIYAIPFTSIVEQSVAIFRDILGAENVLEHHSNYDFEEAAKEGREYERLAVQNWDAPIVVTTNVQLLESLFSNKPGKCRKLHNIANSVIVLDEAQTISIELMRPTLAALEELTLDFGVSVVLCTATQPAVQNEWPFGSCPRELCGAHKELFSKAFDGRIRYQLVGEIPEDDLVDKLASSHQVLCVVGKKAEALALYRDIVARAKESALLDDAKEPYEEGLFHLSAHMIPVHRSKMIVKIRERLDAGERCVVVSTQLIEAGVDFDFPVVWREMAGLDSIVQAAGRCNRNGKRTDKMGEKAPGDVFVFEFTERDGVFARPDERSFLGKTRSIASELLNEDGLDIDESLVSRYFGCCYQSTELDAKNLYKEMSSSKHLQSSDTCLFKRYISYDFEKYSSAYMIIEDEGTPIFVPWGEKGRKLLNRLYLSTHDEASLIHKLQPYSVSIYPRLMRELEREGLVEHLGLVNVLSMEDDCRTVYSEETGLLPPGEEVLNVMAL
ncbi:CRISPR-associated helicase/endonuclease Cas3 [Atopobium sp. oral taxon 810]|uniref:CRISPR-associated helicase/endonuclease Cas3 n=1 Tax=Atopobium sp. oral taxon 810 TaxID=712158 RepID=UPI0003967E6A|nr:CRISPR-associated helicase/endonuclease Cas3 [Atopobium sp. oral taxon 810]ERI06128.1 CRISPR-associated endonuclease Cas3-HD [Atopobium sp. oral taxon 810 str. F0209]